MCASASASSSCPGSCDPHFGIADSLFNQPAMSAQLGGLFTAAPAPLTLPSRFQVDEPVSVAYSEDNVLRHCAITAVRFTGTEVLYDIDVLVSETEWSHLVAVEERYVYEHSPLPEPAPASPARLYPEFVLTVSEVRDSRESLTVSFDAGQNMFGGNSMQLISKDKSVFDGLTPGDQVIIELRQVQLTNMA